MRTLLAFPLLAGCAFTAAQLDPPLGQLARWRGADAALLAAEPVVAPCPADHPACASLHLLRAEACMGLAMAARAPGATCPTLAEAPHLACAGAGYAAAVRLGAQPAALLAGHGAQALLCRAEVQAPAEALSSAGAAMTLAAQAEPGRAAALGAWGATLRARLSAGAARCDAVHQAQALAATLPAEAQGRVLADLALLPGCAP
jgi:hypothetical protein